MRRCTIIFVNQLYHGIYPSDMRNLWSTMICTCFVLKKAYDKVLREFMAKKGMSSILVQSKIYIMKYNLVLGYVKEQPKISRSLFVYIKVLLRVLLSLQRSQIRIRPILGEILWCMVLANDIVLVDEIIDVSNAKLKIMRLALESKGFKLSRSKTKHMECCFGTDNHNKAYGMLCIQLGELGIFFPLHSLPNCNKVLAQLFIPCKMESHDLS